MKEVTMYEADDGSVHKTKEAAHDADMANQMSNAMYSDPYLDWHDTSASQMAEWVVKHYNVTPKATEVD